MSGQIHESRSKRGTSEDETVMTDEELQAAQNVGKTAIDDTEIDNLLAEIDDVLEVNAETFVKNFIQRGGQ